MSKVPWLITLRDLDRYPRRALRACRAGRAVLFYCREKRTGAKMLMALVPTPGEQRILAEARKSYHRGRVKEVCLQDLPPIRRAGSH